MHDSKAQLVKVKEVYCVRWKSNLICPDVYYWSSKSEHRWQEHYRITVTVAPCDTLSLG